MMAGVAQALMPFQWGQGGRKVSPEEVARQRQVAAALAARGQVPQNVGQGLNRVGEALLHNSMTNRAAEAEEAGRSSAAEAFQAMMMGDPDMQGLVAQMDNPWAGPGQQAVSAALLQREMAPPPAPMEINDQLVDPNTYDVVGDYRDAPEAWHTLTPDQRLEIGIPQDDPRPWQINSQTGEIKLPGGAGTNVTNNVGGNNDIGTIPAGWMVDRDANGNVSGMRAIPGSEADRDQQAAGDREGVQAASDAEAAGTMLGVSSQVREIIENADSPATGTNSIPFAWHSGTPAGRIRALVVPLQSGVALNAMMRLKAASAQGATGFGAMNQQELGLLINEIGALDPDRTEPDILLETLDRIENRYKRVIEDIEANVSPDRIQELGLQAVIDAAMGEESDQTDAVVDYTEYFQ